MRNTNIDGSQRVSKIYMCYKEQRPGKSSRPSVVKGEKTLFHSVRGKHRGKQDIQSIRKTLKSLRFQGFLMAGEEGFELPKVTIQWLKAFL